MTTEAQKQAVARFRKKSIKKYYLELNIRTDADIIEYLSTVQSRQGTIKQAIREFMKKGSE